MTDAEYKPFTCPNCGARNIDRFHACQDGPPLDMSRVDVRPHHERWRELVVAHSDWTDAEADAVLNSMMTYEVLMLRELLRRLPVKH